MSNSQMMFLKLKDMRAFYLRNILLLMMVVGVGDAWGQNCGSGLILESVNNLGTNLITPTSACPNGTPCSVTTLCSGPSNMYRLSVNDASGVTITYSWATTSDINSVCTNPCVSSTFDFYKNDGTLRTITVTATDNSTCTTTYQINVGATAATPPAPSITNNTASGVTITGSPSANQGAVYTYTGNACENTLLDFTAASGSGCGTACTYSWNSTPSGTESGTNDADYEISSVLSTNFIITVTAESSVGCLSETRIDLTINTLPNVTASASPSNTICLGESVTLTGGGASAYVWDNSVTNGDLITPASTTTYNVVGTDANGCTATDAVEVTVNTPPTITIASPNPTICQGQSVTQTASGGTSYSWSVTSAPANVSNISDPSIPNPSFTPSVTTSYTVTGTDGNGCTATATTTITVNPVINLVSNVSINGAASTPGSAFAVCDDDEITVTITGTGLTTDGNYGNNIDWNWGGTGSGPIGSTRHTFTETMTTGALPTIYNYSLTYENANTCISTLPLLEITVNPNPVVTISGNAGSVYCSGTLITLTALDGTASNWSNANIIGWEIDGVAVSSSNSNDYVFTVNNSGGSTTTFEYAVIVENGGCSQIAVTEVDVSPGVTLNLPPNGTRCTGNNIEIAANASGGVPGYNYTWSGVTCANGQNSATCRVNNAANGTYNFSVTVTDGSTSGCESTDTQETIVSSCGTVSIDMLVNGATPLNVNDVVCVGDNITLIADCASCSQSPLIYAWGVGGSNSTISFTIFDYFPDTFPVSLSIGYNQTNGDESEYNAIGEGRINLIISRPNIILPNDTLICEGGGFDLTAECPGCATSLTYRWKDLSMPFVINTIPPVSDTLSYSIVNTPILTNSISYEVEVTDIYGCKDRDSVSVNFIPLPGTTIDQGTDAQYCPTSSVLLTTSTLNCNNCSYAWTTGQISSSISVNQDDVYSVTTTNNGCTDVASITITKYPLSEPVIVGPNGSLNTVPSTAYLCGTGPTWLAVDSVSCIGCSYTWNIGSSDDTITVNFEGGFFVQAIDTNGCIGYSIPVFVIESLDGQGAIASANPQQICNNNPAILEVSPCVGCSYQWYSNGAPTVPITGADTRLYSTTTRGTYFAEITNDDGCVYTSNLVTVDSVTVVTPPIFSSTDTVCNTVGGAASFVTLFTTADPNHLSYQWYRGNPLLQISGATNSSFATTVTGDYAVAVTYGNGCVKFSPIKTINSANFTVSLTSPSNVVICEGTSAALTTTTFVGYTYQWYRNGSTVPGANASQYLVDSSGFYNVYVTNNWGCSRLSSSITLTESSNTINSNAFPDYTEICPGEVATLQVSLCSNCKYQWFNATTGLSIPATPIDSSIYFRVTVTNGGSYYARVSDDFCTSISDTIQVVALPVITPSINTNTNIVCEGVTPTIFTQGCVGCTYTWKRDSNIVFGALNDTFLIVSNVSDAGVYTLEVTYPNGCTGFSNAITITDGSYLLDITAADVIICNNDNELLSSTAALPAICNLGCNYQWFRNNIAIPSSNAQNYTANIGGNFKLRMTDSRGCIEESNIIELTEVNLIPNITSSSTAICGNDAILLSYPDSANCTGCTYVWQEGGSPATFGVITNPSYVTDIGINAVGVYRLVVTQLGCEAPSNIISLNQISALSIPVAATDQNICNGDTTTVYRVGGGCTDCQFQWLLDSLPILAATTPSLTVSNPGNYNLQMSIGATGCRDTSAVITLLPVQSPIDSFSLSAALYTPLTNTGPQVNLQNAVFPAGIAQASSNDFFFSQPFNAALGPNSGLSGPNNDTLNPGIAGSGYHRIYYQFDTMGCSFVYDDILFVFGEPNVNVVNENFNAPQYEACVSDTIQLQVFNMPFKIDSVYLFDVNNNYQLVDIASSALQDTTYGLDVVWNGTIRIGIPAWAKASFMMVTSAGNVDTFITPFILIHNTELDISGLPGVVCSANPPLPLTGTPAGGYFTAEYHTGGVPAMGTLVTAAFSGSNFNTGAMTRASYGPDMVQNIRVVYNFQNSYTNGITCPQVDTTSIIVEARGVFLDSVKYNPISVSQDRELLSNLVFRVYPYQSQPSWIRNNYNQGSISFNGNFTFPAGNPVDFLPKNAGVGKHAMTYRIHNGVCMNSKTDSIQVIPAPNSIGIPDSMCRTQSFANFGRHTGLYSYFDGPNIAIQPGIFFSDTINIINVYSTTGPNEGLTVVSPALNLEQYNYSPLAVTNNSDTLKMEYWYKKVEYISGVPVDTIMYIVGSIVTPIYIEDTFAVDIIDSIVANVYCEVDQLYLLAGSPSGGIFTLEGGTSAYAGGALLVNNILNPFDVHSPENTNTTYNLTYTKMGAVCQNSDTKQITIPEPLDPSFGTASGKRVFCQTDPIENIVINTIGAFTPVWLVNGITQPQPPMFNPILLNPGNQIVRNMVTDDIFGCVYTAVDTYRINPLPVLAVLPPLDTAYCTNDPIDSFMVSPNPICSQFVTGGLTMLFEGFDAVAFPWNRANTGPGNTWVRSTVLPYAGTGAAFVNTSNDVEDAWMFTPTLSLTTGHTYLVTLFAAAGTCSPPPCFPASFRVRVGQGQTIAAQMSGTTFGDTAIAHTFYQPYTFTYTHTGLSGNYNFSFQCYSGVDARSLTLDDISIVDGSVSGCVLGGTGTMVGPGINYISDSTYAFNPTIVAPGNYNIRYVYTAAATGCTDSIQMPVRIKAHPLPLFTDLDPQYCDNAASVPLVGTPSGGTFSSNGPNLVNTPFWAFDPNTGFNNEIVSYTYTDIQTLCTTTVSDTTTIVSITDSVTISTIDPSGYCVNVDSILLNVSSVFGDPDTVLAGYFYGMGVRNGANGPLATNFYPDSAVIDGGRYGNFIISYVYPTMSGCFDTTRATVTVHAMPDLSFNFMVPDTSRLPDSICLNADIVQVRVNNRVITGNFGEIVYDTLIPIGPFLGGAFVPSLGQLDTLNPMRFGVGWHNISYTFTDNNGCTTMISDTFRVDTVPVIQFAGLNPNRIYCENEIPSLLLAYPPYYPGSGYLQLTSGLDSIVVDSSFYLINPAVFADTTNPNRRWDIYYTFEDLNFCSSSGTDSFFVRPYPRITLAMPPTFCSGPTLEPLMPFVTPQGGVFTDNLVVTGIVQDSLLNLSGTMGPRRITYYYVDTVSTCRNNAFQDITIFNTPDVDFYALGGCVGANITFVSDSLLSNITPGLDSITRIEWIYGDGNNTVLVPTSATVIPNQSHVYTTNGVYQVSLAVTNQGQCTDTVTRQLVISPFVNTYPYLEDFQAGTGDWYQEQPINVPDSIALWQHAQLLGANINDPGNFAWVTKANAPYTYELNERGWVYSPCFDFTNAWRPMIAFDIWRDFLTDIDGAVLEFYDDYSNSWKSVGETGSGINWYQTDFLVARPGNQPNVTYPKGWTGESGTWEKARYKLDNLVGRPFVRFRVAFASDPNTVLEGHEGFAFDSVWIGERGRNVLVEHFSNYYHVNQQGTIMDVIDKKVYDEIYNSINGRDVSLIQYQTNIQQVDPINALYSVDFDSRVLYYGINANSQIRIDGQTYGNGRSENLSQWHLDYDMLQFPVFDIQIAPLIFAGNTIQISAAATALANLDSADYTMTFAITEDDVWNGRGFPMKSVLRKFIPDASGFPYQRSWTPGQSVAESGSWVYNFGNLNPNKIEAVVYIQNNNTKDVLQVATSRDLSIFPPVGTESVEEEAAAREDILGMNLFPNPAANYFNVSFDQPLSDDYQWALIDVLGRVLLNGKATSGTTQMTVDTDRLSEGTYFFVIRNDKAYAQRKVVISHRP
jgi:large repetitive protein